MSSELRPDSISERFAAPRTKAFTVHVEGSDLFHELSEEEIDALPFGLIAVDKSGRIEQYNAYESRLARLAKERVIGRNFFRDVAPCTAVVAFQGRFEEFVREAGDGTMSFEYLFRFPFGEQRVIITFVRSAKTQQVKILVNRHDDR